MPRIARPGLDFKAGAFLPFGRRTYEPMQTRFRCTFNKACHAIWAVKVRGMSQTATAIVLELNVGTVSHVIHGRRFPGAYPVPIPGLE